MPTFDSFDGELDDIAERCGSGDPGVRRVAMMDLAELIEPGATTLLLRGLGDADAEVRAAAARSLDEHDGPAVVQGLVHAL